MITKFSTDTVTLFCKEPNEVNDKAVYTKLVLTSAILTQAKQLSRSVAGDAEQDIVTLIVFDSDLPYIDALAGLHSDDIIVRGTTTYNLNTGTLGGLESAAECYRVTRINHADKGPCRLRRWEIGGA